MDSNLPSERPHDTKAKKKPHWGIICIVLMLLSLTLGYTIVLWNIKNPNHYTEMPYEVQ